MKFGLVDIALKLIDEMPNQNNVIWSVVIADYIQMEDIMTLKVFV